MNPVLSAKVDLLADNFEEINGAFKWDSSLSKHFAAIVAATREAKTDVVRIKEAKKIIEEETSWMSYFRGSNAFLIAVMLSGESSPDYVFRNAVTAYEAMKEAGFSRSSYLAIAAYFVAKGSDAGKWPVVIERMKGFHKAMKANHYWLTSADDYVYAAVLALTQLEIEPTMKRIEDCYHLLKESGLSQGNELQNLSHILALGEDTPENKCRTAMALYKQLKAKKCKLSGYGLSALGVLTLIVQDVDAVVEEVCEVFEMLHDKKGFSMWHLDTGSRAILAATLVADFYGDRLSDGTLEAALANSISSILIAQQAAMAASISAATAATAASSSN